MDSTITKILDALNCPISITRMTQFCAEEDGAPYNVWKLDTTQGSFVLKKTTPEEQDTYRIFLSNSSFAPAVYAFGEYDGSFYMLMEYVQGNSLSRCTRPRLQLALDALITSQEQYWNDTVHAKVGFCYEKCYENRQKQLPYMKDLTEAYQAYLDVFSSVPRTLCNDDLLPFNILISEEKATIIDWEYAGILPYPCAIARLIAFGEEDPEALFQMTEADRQFALWYYYDHLIKAKGISPIEYERTMRLFFLKEYSEWIYCAGISDNYDLPHYKKYYPKAKRLALELGFQ